MDMFQSFTKTIISEMSIRYSRNQANKKRTLMYGRRQRSGIDKSNTTSDPGLHMGK